MILCLLLFGATNFKLLSEDTIIKVPNEELVIEMAGETSGGVEVNIYRVEADTPDELVETGFTANDGTYNGMYTYEKGGIYKIEVSHDIFEYDPNPVKFMYN